MVCRILWPAQAINFQAWNIIIMLKCMVRDGQHMTLMLKEFEAGLPQYIFHFNVTIVENSVEK